MGHDFGHVRVHTDKEAAQSARAIHARAWTFGHHVVMSAGVYQPHTPAGRHLLAHELTHVAQMAGQDPSAPPASVSDPHDPAEQEAEARAHSFLAGPLPVGRRSTTALHRTCGAAIGSVGGCTARGGDIADFGRSSEDLFLFDMACDDLATGEEERLTAYAARIGPDDEATVDGFASEEGDARANIDLSCARAHAAADVLAVAGVAAVDVRLYAHGGVPGDKAMHRSVALTVTPIRSPAPAKPAPAEPALPDPARPRPDIEDCSAAQTAMLVSHLADARKWVDDASRRIGDYADVFASPRHSAVPGSPEEANVVRDALTANFHTTESGDVLEIRDGFADLHTALNADLTFECEDDCDENELAYVRGKFAFIRRRGNIHICPDWFSADYFTRVAALIHERAHQHPGATDNAYDWQPSYGSLSPSDAIDNAESYAISARQIYHGGAHGPRN